MRIFAIGIFLIQIAPVIPTRPMIRRFPISNRFIDRSDSISSSFKISAYFKRGGNRVTSINEPVRDGKSSYHRPRRNYWGNLNEKDTYSENPHTSSYDHSKYEDDHDGFYNNDMLWK